MMDEELHLQPIGRLFHTGAKESAVPVRGRDIAGDHLFDIPLL
jgi:hypothetical protein